MPIPTARGKYSTRVGHQIWGPGFDDDDSLGRKQGAACSVPGILWQWLADEFIASVCPTGRQALQVTSHAWRENDERYPFPEVRGGAQLGRWVEKKI